MRCWLAVKDTHTGPVDYPFESAKWGQEGGMTKLQDEIAASFLKKLEASEDVAPEMIDELKKLLSTGKKLKAPDLVKIFAPPAGGQVK